MTVKRRSEKLNALIRFDTAFSRLKAEYEEDIEQKELRLFDKLHNEIDALLDNLPTLSDCEIPTAKNPQNVSR